VPQKESKYLVANIGTITLDPWRRGYTYSQLKYRGRSFIRMQRVPTTEKSTRQGAQPPHRHRGGDAGSRPVEVTARPRRNLRSARPVRLAPVEPERQQGEKTAGGRTCCTKAPASRVFAPGALPSSEQGTGVERSYGQSLERELPKRQQRELPPGRAR